jgi:hypothetical protein
MQDRGVIPFDSSVSAYPAVNDLFQKQCAAHGPGFADGRVFRERVVAHEFPLHELVVILAVSIAIEVNAIEVKAGATDQDITGLGAFAVSIINK